MPLMRIHRKRTLRCDFAIQRSSHAILATSTKLLDIKSKVYRSGGDLVDISN